MVWKSDAAEQTIQARRFLVDGTPIGSDFQVNEDTPASWPRSVYPLLLDFEHSFRSLLPSFKACKTRFSARDSSGSIPESSGLVNKQTHEQIATAEGAIRARRHPCFTRGPRL